jgi:serine/threonine-protein kinase HipA
VITSVQVVVSEGGKDYVAGMMYPAYRRGAVVGASYVYDQRYLSTPVAYPLDPVLPLAGSTHHTPVGWPLFGAFTDCAPDRWGRTLRQRAERAGAGEERRTARTLSDLDHLLGVRDDLRQGALRFRIDEAGPFLSDDITGVPVLTEIGELLELANRQSQEALVATELRRLVRGGSSLGGARPKAHVRLADGTVGIAKFPSDSSDTWNVMAWEGIALALASSAGIEVPDFELVEIGRRRVLLLHRFDREPEPGGETPRRIGYVSAMTMLERRDGDIGDFLDLVDVVEEQSAHATVDIHQLWRRAVFSALICNTDNHLRNHGFLHHRGSKWKLAPAFDLNPNPQALDLAVGVAGARTVPIGAAIDNCEMFRLDRPQAVASLGEIYEAVSSWRRVALRTGLSAAEVDLMAPAFEHPGADQARALLRV